jgi:hypothetical protein
MSHNSRDDATARDLKLQRVVRFGSAALPAISSLGCSATPVVALDIGSTRLAVGDSLLVGAVFGHHHPGLFRDDIHVISRTEPTLFRWTTSDSSVVAVDGRGMVYARRLGAAEISASYDGVRAQNPAIISVIP